MNTQAISALRASLIAVWLGTAVISVAQIHGASGALLGDAGIQSPGLADGLTLAGAALDAAIGLAMWFKPSRAVYRAALLAMLALTVLASVMTPLQWLHPFGPLLKNLPIAAALWLLMEARE